MKNILKKLIKKLFPSYIKKYYKMKNIINMLDKSLNILIDNDFKIIKLRKLLSEVEYYQPAYMINILDIAPKRDCKDRCRLIEKSLDNIITGQKILDIGSSLGYICYYFADRGAITTGWESDPKNVEVSKLIGQINGIETKIENKSFCIEALNDINKDDYDVIIILSVLHHIIHYKGLEYVQELIKAMFEKVSTLIVELALKNEDSSLFWDASLPDDELAIFDLIKTDVDIKYIGEFDTHLSLTKRPIYLISKKEKFIHINGKKYVYDKKTNIAYNDSDFPYMNPLLGRFYYFSYKFVIKEYLFNESTNENKIQIITDISNMLFWEKLSKVKSTKLLDFEINNRRAIIVFLRDSGELLSEILGKKEIDLKIVAKDILEFLLVIMENNIHHNDIRSWNILWDGNHAQVIDYGLMSSRIEDDDIIALLWVLNAIIVKHRENGIYGYTSLPPKDNFITNDLLELYEAINKGEKNPKKLLCYLKQS